MPAVNKDGFAHTKTTPATGVEAVTPHDTNELTNISRSVWVGGAGNLSVRMEDGTTAVLSGIAAGTLLPIRVRGINATNTTATLIVALN